MNASEIISQATESPSLGILDTISEIYALFGLRTPATRGGATLVGIYLLLTWAKPQCMYLQGQQKRPWSVTNDAQEAVFFTPEVVSVILAILAAGV